MTLQSQAFRDDPKLQAAARDPSAHIIRGARGTHVAKIQNALNILDHAELRGDGEYGPLTAAAVLAYKRKRDIVNYAYQTAADDIVGVMTMTVLDREMAEREREPVLIRPCFGGKSVGGRGDSRPKRMRLITL
jgi:peptidoglycan hydrolase-like protein with peptidoglycan-binding domain